MLPILVQNKRLSLVEVDGQAVVTAADLAKGLEYKNERSVRNIFARNKDSFHDFGVYDMTRGHQIDATLPKTCDTALVRMLTPSADDGHGGGLQDVRVFTKRGALKICMKSNQPKAVRVQDALIDLYEQVESGQLIGAARFGRMFEALVAQVSELKTEITHLKKQPPVAINLPDDTALPITLERKSQRRRLFFNALRFDDVRGFVIRRCRAGERQIDILDALKERWADDPERSRISYSALNRFITDARCGRLKDFGIDLRDYTVH